MYQSGATVVETVRSIAADLDASALTGEILIVNDGSTDDGPRLVGDLAVRDPRICLISQPNRGLAAARNTGIDAARGEYLRFIDADDLATPGSTNRLIRAAQTTGAACGPHELIDEAGLTMGRWSPAIPGRDGCIGLDELSSSNRMGVGTVLLHRDTLRLERFDETLRVCEDWDLWLRLAERGTRWAVTPPWAGPMKRYRLRRASLSKNFASMLDIGTGVLRRAFLRAHTPSLREGAGGWACACESETVSNDARYTRALAGQALAFSTMQALADGPDALQRAAAMLRGTPPATFTPPALAEAALWAVLLGRGERPEAPGPTRRHWLDRTLQWWACLDALSLTADDTRDPLVELAAMVVPPERIAAECVNQALARGERALVIIGLGQNGLRVLHEAQRLGVDFRIRDDRLADHLHDLDRSLAAHVDPMNAPIPNDHTPILTPSEDSRLASRLHALAPHAVPVRWSQVQADLARSELADMKADLAPAAVPC
jgi:hypothetical protein